jgi:hypothetical protein
VTTSWADQALRSLSRDARDCKASAKVVSTLRRVTLRQLSKIDVAYTTPDGITGLMVVAVEWEPESLRLAQLAMKLSVLHAHGAEHQPYRIEVSCPTAEPPTSVVGLVARHGGVVYYDKGREPVAGRPGEYPADELDWPAIHAANAALFATEHGLDWSMDSLLRLDEILAESYRTHEDSDHEDGDLAVLAGSYASEVMIAEFGGTWQPSVPETGLPEFRIALGRDHGSDVGALGKVRKFLRNGPADAVHPMAKVLADIVIV